MSEKQRRVITFRLSYDLYEALRAEADSTGRSLNQVVTDAVRAGMGRHGLNRMVRSSSYDRYRVA